MGGWVVCLGCAYRLRNELWPLTSLRGVGERAKVPILGWAK